MQLQTGEAAKTGGHREGAAGGCSHQDDETAETDESGRAASGGRKRVKLGTAALGGRNSTGELSLARGLCPVLSVASACDAMPARLSVTAAI